MDLYEDTVLLSMIVSFFSTYMALMIGYYILIIVSRWKVYTKAGKPGWASIIPIYSDVVSYQIAGMSPWLLLLYLVPIVNIIAIPILMIVNHAKIASAFGKGVLFTLGLIFLTPIFYMILGFGSAEYNKENI